MSLKVVQSIQSGRSPDTVTQQCGAMFDNLKVMSNQLTALVQDGLTPGGKKARQASILAFTIAKQAKQLVAQMTMVTDWLSPPPSRAPQKQAARKATIRPKAARAPAVSRSASAAIPLRKPKPPAHSCPRFTQGVAY